MTITDWNAIILYLSITLAIVSVVICFVLLRKVAKQEKDYKTLSEFVGNSRTKIQINEHDIRKLFRRVEPNVDNIESLQQQMAQIHELLGTVMGASDFIAGEFDSPADRVEGIREKLKWERERRKLNQANKSDFYEG